MFDKSGVRIRLWVTISSCMGVFLLTTLLDGAAPPGTAGRGSLHSNRFALPRGFIYQESLFVASEEVEECEHDQSLPEGGNQWVEIDQLFLQNRVGLKPKEEWYQYTNTFAADPPFRWRFVGDSYWGVKEAAMTNSEVQRLPINELHCFNPLNPKGKEDYETRHPPHSQWTVQPVQRYAAELIRKSKGSLVTYYIPGVDFDLLPIGPHEGVLFLVHNGLVHVWNGKARAAKDKLGLREWAVSWTERKTDAFRMTQKEPLLAYGDRDNWFFLTPSGKLYVCRKPAKGKSRNLEPFYNDANAPLKAMVTDCASNRTWVFTAPLPHLADKRKPTYFELAENAERHPYTVKPVNGKELSAPIRKVLPYARVLLADKRIK